MYNIYTYYTHTHTHTHTQRYRYRPAIDEEVDEVEGAAADRDVGVLQALYDGAPVALDGLDVRPRQQRQGVEAHVADVVVAVCVEGYVHICRVYICVSISISISVSILSISIYVYMKI